MKTTTHLICFAVLSACVLRPGAAHAVPIEFTFEGTASGTYTDPSSGEAIEFINEAYTVTALGNTGERLVGNYITRIYPELLEVAVAGINNGAAVTIELDEADPELYVYATPTEGSVGIANERTNADALLVVNATLIGYDLSGPVDLLESDYQYVDSLGFDFATTGGGRLVFMSGDAGTALFQARVVPEPSSLALLGIGGLCVLHRRRP